MPDRPPVWKMIDEAITALGGSAANTQIRDWIQSTYGGVNPRTIAAQIIVCTVNHSSRICYPENQRPRRCDGRYDLLWRPLPSSGQVEKYDPTKHGSWIISRDENGRLIVAQSDSPSPTDSLEVNSLSGIDAPEESGIQASFGFALESHLRDFLCRHLPSLQIQGLPSLELFVDESQRVGKEYQTEVGRIDILAQDANGDFVVFELKLERGLDQALGQLLRYMGWVKRHLANGREVTGVIVASSIDERLRYAVTMAQGVKLFTYEVNFSISEVGGIGSIAPEPAVIGS